MKEFECFNCGKTCSEEPLSHHKLKQKDGEFCKFCPDCKEVYEHAIESISDPTGVVLEAGIRLGLGKKDPFFRIQLIYEKNCVPRWQVVDLNERGGLVVFVNKADKYMKQVENDKHPVITVPVEIIRKKERVAFAVPFTDNTKTRIMEKGETNGS